ncbi:MAG: type II toxin-antitoxin system YafQ family toxin [Oscillospiraceae bacterium]|jgi:mRNA interferase YafQ|nr:type II toxin-antitoxin system YafQ family toxin [Oscillospiraceae bacterium]
MLTVHKTAKFRRDYKRAYKRNLDMTLLDNVILVLASEQPLDQKYIDHALTGNRKDFRECHIAPDWLLIYKIDKGRLILTLSDTGSHADLLDN